MRASVRDLVTRLEFLSKTITSELFYQSQPIEPSHVYTEGVILWLGLMRRYSPQTVRNSVFIQLFFKLHKADVFLVGKFLKEVSHQIRCLPPNSSIFLEYFKGIHLGGTLYSGLILQPLFELSDLSKDSNRRLLISIFEFLGRINIILPIEEKLIQDYKDDELRLKALEFDKDYTQELRTILREWLEPYELKTLPHHGPGAVASLKGRPCIEDKYRDLATDQRLYRTLYSECPIESLPLLGLPILKRQSELLFVPKTLVTYRTICKEPSTLQFWQQAIMKSLDSLFKSTDLRKHISLQDQERSRKLAQVGSINLKYDTIDLSRASDSVSYRLVKAAFRSTKLLPSLIGSRSDKVLLPNGEELPLEKFAPMGSAVCFPIECLLFAGICEMGYRHTGRKKKDFIVYGDDIICHHTCTQEIMHLLSCFGFIVNTQKSFYSAEIPFRESCGGEYYQGVDVTPMRLSRWFSGFSQKEVCRNPDRAIALCNLLFELDCVGIREIIVKRLLTLRYPPVFSQVGQFGLWSCQATNFHLRKTKDKMSFVHGGLKCRQKKTLQSDSCETFRLYEYFSHEYERKPLAPFLEQERSYRIGKHDEKWGRITTPVWVISS